MGRARVEPRLDFQRVKWRGDSFAEFAQNGLLYWAFC